MSEQLAYWRPSLSVREFDCCPVMDLDKAVNTIQLTDRLNLVSTIQEGIINSNLKVRVQPGGNRVPSETWGVIWLNGLLFGWRTNPSLAQGQELAFLRSNHRLVPPIVTHWWAHKLYFPLAPGLFNLSVDELVKMAGFLKADWNNLPDREVRSCYRALIEDSEADYRRFFERYDYENDFMRSAIGAAICMASDNRAR